MRVLFDFEDVVVGVEEDFALALEVAFNITRHALTLPPDGLGALERLALLHQGFGLLVFDVPINTLLRLVKQLAHGFNFFLLKFLLKHPHFLPENFEVLFVALDALPHFVCLGPGVVFNQVHCFYFHLLQVVLSLVVLVGVLAAEGLDSLVVGEEELELLYLGVEILFVMAQEIK